MYDVKGRIDKTNSRNVGGVKVGVEVMAEIRRGIMVEERENYTTKMKP